ncbi:MAG TPA: ATP-binding protein, partial [Bacteroidota bacterium]|nr:ATP-binding protein [Bacteroidota bacterium]
DRSLPSGLDRNGTWIKEMIEGKEYDSFYFQGPDGDGTSWYAVSLESLGVQWHFYTFLRYIIFYFFFIGAGFVFYGIFWFVQGRNVHVTVRMKLLMAFVVVSLIPVVILAYYNRQYAREQIEESTNRQLSDQTSVIVAEIQHTLGLNIPIALEQLNDEQCAGIAGDVNTNFNVYSRHELQASSKPEIFSAELLDKRLGAEAFMNLFYRKRSFYSEYESIGLFRYVVGYRPIVAQNGTVIGAISVPTLFRQTDIDEELTRRNVFLYGTYAFAFFLAVIVGTFFANQISLPIRRLREATKRLSRGEMNAELHSGKSDELGQLESAFKEMVSDLRQSQEQILKNERELAWKEMAKQVAHEIKNPLTPMKLSIQHLRQAYHDQVKDFSVILQQVSTTILDQIETLSRIASEFSLFARMPAQNLQVCNVHAILEETKQLFQQEPEVTFEMRFDAVTADVRADHEELRRAFINIIRNALQAMNDKGTVIIQTHNDNDHLVVDIIDDGPGIPKEIQARLFEPSFSTKTDGTGLGLAIVKQTVRDLNGEISLVSEIGKGTTVTMTLPTFNA